MSKIKAFFYRIFIKDWNLKYPIILSAFSVIFTGAGWYSQHKASDNYEKNTRQVIINSTKLANFQLNMLIGKIKNSSNVPLTIDNLNFQVNSLNQNLSVIRDVQITNLPANESMNYQTYRQDLSDSIYKINSNIQAFKNTYHVSGSEPIPITESEKQNLLETMWQIKYVMGHDQKLIEEDKNLYDENYKKFIDTFDKNNKDPSLETKTQ